MAIHKEKLEFTLMMADDALKQHFDIHRDGCGRFQELRELCRNLLPIGNVRQTYARLLKLELNQRAVEAAIRSLPPERQKYVRMKYREEKSVIAISLALHVSVAQLNLWHRSTLEHVAQFMLYTLHPDDLFFHAKIAGMVRLLSETMTVFSKLDTDGIVITEDWLSAIAMRHAKYRMMLEVIEGIMQRKPLSLHDRIVAEKLSCPYKPAGLIAQACHVDDAVVSRHLREFSEEMAGYLT